MTCDAGRDLRPGGVRDEGQGRRRGDQHSPTTPGTDSRPPSSDPSARPRRSPAGSNCGGVNVNDVLFNVIAGRRAVGGWNDSGIGYRNGEYGHPQVLPLTGDRHRAHPDPARAVLVPLHPRATPVGRAPDQPAQCPRDQAPPPSLTGRQPTTSSPLRQRTATGRPPPSDRPMIQVRRRAVRLRRAIRRSPRTSAPRPR